MRRCVHSVCASILLTILPVSQWHWNRREHPTSPSCHTSGKACWIVPSQARRCTSRPSTARHRRPAWLWPFHAPKGEGKTRRDELGRANETGQGSAVRSAGKGYGRDAVQGHPGHRRSKTRIGQASQVGLVRHQRASLPSLNWFVFRPNGADGS